MAGDGVRGGHLLCVVSIHEADLVRWKLPPGAKAPQRLNAWIVQRPCRFQTGFRIPVYLHGRTPTLRFIGVAFV